MSERRAGFTRLGMFWLPTAAVALLLAATDYELAIALGAISIGPVPGSGAAGESTVFVAALLTLLVGATWAVAASASSSASTRLGAMLLAPVAVAFLLARFYGYDPYYAPALRRMSAGGLVSAGWIYALVALCLAAGLLAARHRRAALALTAPLLLLVGVTAVLESAGH